MDIKFHDYITDIQTAKQENKLTLENVMFTPHRSRADIDQNVHGSNGKIG